MPPSGNCIAVIYTEDEFDEMAKRKKYSPYLRHVEERVTSELEDYMKRQDKLPEEIRPFKGHALLNNVEMAKSSNIHAFFREIKKSKEKMSKETNQTSIALNKNYHKNTLSKKNAFLFGPEGLPERREEIPVFVIDTDGMNAEKLSKYISKACEGRKKYLRLLDFHAAGAFRKLFETLFLHKVKTQGKFGIIFQADNLETLEFNGFLQGAKLGEYSLKRLSKNMTQTSNLVQQARFAVKKRNIHPVSKYGGKSPQKFNYHEKSVNDSIEALQDQKINASLTDREAPKLYDAIDKSGLYAEFTSSIYLHKEAFKEYRKIVKLRQVDPVSPGLRLEHFDIYEFNK